MKACHQALLILLLLPLLGAEATEVEGDVWGAWTQDDSPYLLVGQVRVPPGSTLVIEPGVLVNFQGHYKFIVDSSATFLAIGTAAFPIRFTTDDPFAGWHGIRFLYADSASQISYCVLQYGKASGALEADRRGGAIFCFHSSPTISNNIVRWNWASAWGGGISCYRSDPKITNNTIRENSTDGGGGGIDCYASYPIISDNSIVDNRTAAVEVRGGGGICCASSAPTISSNIITGNAADSTKGGGIYCIVSSPTISDNVITANSAHYGGGISCEEGSNPVVSNNMIADNYAGTEGSGGGIYCHYSSPTISYNTITHDSAGASGGGVYCYYSSSTISNNTINRNKAGSSGSRRTAFGEGGGISSVSCTSSLTISDNTISDNWADHEGAGIFCQNSSPTITNNAISGGESHRGGGISCWASSSPTISNNIISRNSATTEQGGGIACWASSNPIIGNNTLSGNSASDYGGGLYCNSSSPTVINTIFWGDTSPDGPEIYAEGGSNPTVTYCDVAGGWPGQDNLNCDPWFVNPNSGNYHLKMGSCCIDAGDPEVSYEDPDGTRNDIGALYFRQEGGATIELMPHSQCIIPPPDGGPVNYDVWIYNPTPHDVCVDVWFYAYIQGAAGYGPFDLHRHLRVRQYRSIGQNNVVKSVPGAAPAGKYHYVGYIGDFESTIIDSSFFTFTKLGTPEGSVLGLLEGCDWLKRDGLALEHEAVLPTDFALRQNYPNPFNAKTTIHYELRASKCVRLKVYNLPGQRVATLVDEKQEAGYKSVTWDASQFSSGLYFYKLTAGDYTETKRMMLLK